MNIVNRLTLRQLKENKKRTLVTIIGVIISVAMVTAVTTLGVSFMDLFQRQTIARTGEWHVLYKDVDKGQLEAVEKDEDTKNLVISRDRGYALLEGSQNDYKPYIFIKEYNNQGFAQFPIELSRGRLPQAENEIVISEEIIENAKVDYQIGDQVTLDIGTRFSTIDAGREDRGEELTQGDSLIMVDDERREALKVSQKETYTVVGMVKRPLWEPAWAPGYTVLSYIDNTMIQGNEIADALVVLNQVKRSLYAHAENLAKKNNIEKVVFNDQLLRYYGVTDNSSLHKTLYSLSAIIMAVIVIGSVSLIYNAFAISVAERSRHLGMLSSVGATKRQKRNSVFFEGAIIGLISIPVGIISGLFGIGITFWCINPMILGIFSVTEKLTLVVTPLSILAACAVSIITIFISTYLPARKASRVSAIDAIRQATDVKLTGKKVKTSKLIRRLFGIEGEIGLKNLKRNRRRYQATVFSLVISIVLFLTVSFFTASLQKSLELSQDGVNFDIQVTINNEKAEIDDQLLKSIVSLENVTESSVIRSLNVSSWISEEAMAEELKKQVKDDKGLLKDGKYSYYIDISALDEENLKEYTEAVGADYGRLTDPDTPSGIIIDTISYEDMTAEKFVETKAIHTQVGKSIDLFERLPGEKLEEREINKLEIAALTDQLPMGVFSTGLGGLNIIVSQQVMEKVIDNMEYPDVQTKLLLKSSDPMDTQHEIEDMKEKDIYVYNLYQARQQEEQMILLMKVFTYGFIVLITAISIANIFNTISTSISLRKREFAMLKSVGMTPKGFNKMINYESIFYGIKALCYGLPISLMVMYLIYRSLMNTFSYGFNLPWISIIYVVAAVFIIVSSAMIYSSQKVKKENIIDALKQENI